MLYRAAVAGFSVASDTGRTVVAVRLPTEKVSAPDTGWLSADTTRQATV